MLAYFLASYASLLPGQLVSSGIPTELDFKFPYFSRVVGGWGEIENKAQLSPAGARAWGEFGNMKALTAFCKTKIERENECLSSSHILNTTNKLEGCKQRNLIFNFVFATLSV